MTYKLIITKRADELLDNIVHHLLYRLKNEQAAIHLLNGIENVYNRLEENPQLVFYLLFASPIPKIKNKKGRFNTCAKLTTLWTK